MLPNMADPDPAASGLRVARGQRLDGMIAAAVALAWFTVLMATSRDFGLVWDEGNTLQRERTLAKWFSLAWGEAGRPRSEALSRVTLERLWPFAREEPDGHPPFFAELSLAGWRLTRGLVSPPTAYRVGPMFLAATTAGLIYLYVASRRGRVAGLTASTALLLVPQCFALAHYAHYDMPMACCWILAQAAFAQSLRRPGWAVPFGVLLGLSAGSKFTGLFACAAPLAWVTIFEWAPRIHLVEGRPSRSRGLLGTRAIAVGLPIAALTLYAILPPWWADPAGGAWRFLASNLSRHDTVRIPTLYFGQIYGFSLPWHNSIVLTAITVPVLLLVLAAVGIVDALARRPVDREGVLWILSWLVLMVVRAMPNAPGHDGVRQLLASTLSLAVLAGFGAGALMRTPKSAATRWLAAALCVAAAAEPVVAIAQLYPYTLSYYNVVFGGLRGADRRGFEVTFYWDTMGPEFLDWVRKEHAKRRLELRFPIALMSIRFLRQWGDLPADIPIVPMTPATEPDYVLQRRRGVYYPYDWWLEDKGRPRFVIRRQGVDLLRVYPYDESVRAYLATKDVKTPEHLRNY